MSLHCLGNMKAGKWVFSVTLSTVSALACYLPHLSILIIFFVDSKAVVLSIVYKIIFRLAIFISLPSSWQHYLVVMATSLDKLEIKAQFHYLHVKCFHMVKIFQKYFQYIRRYSTKYASFLAMSYLTFTNKPCQLWSYWAKVHQIFRRGSPIISAVSAYS